MLDFLTPLTLVSHCLPRSSAKPFNSDAIPRSSIPASSAVLVPPTAHTAGHSNIQQADVVSQASSRSPSPLFARSSEVNHPIHSLQPISKYSYTSSTTKKSSSSSSLSVGSRKCRGNNRETGEKQADWSQSESESINLDTIPSRPKEKMDPVEPLISSLTRRPGGTPQRPPPAQRTPKPTSTSRFPFFSRQASVQEGSPLVDTNDEILNLNIQTALFPAGQADPFSPAAFKNLVQNAEGLLSRLQTAYKERTTSLHEMAMEKEAQAEELEGCQMRARHLKLQLDGMTAKFAEQDHVMMNLVDNLAQEKQSRQMEQEAHKRSIKMMKSPRADHLSKDDIENPEVHAARRGSDISTLSAISDSGFESDEENLTDHMYRKHQDAPSPSVSVSSVSTTNSHDTTSLAKLPPPTICYPPAIAQPSRPKPPSHVFSSFSAARMKPTLASTLRNPLGPSCANCQGSRASEAWNVVNVLKDENRGLKERLEHIESSVDGCLDMVMRMVENGEPAK